ncbi:MAG: biotin/lipoyl-containing protein [Deltaproteobacteria bacterium]|nr:biotin/lipoyl-containing protein [Deltaproteobacteria bacterium]
MDRRYAVTVAGQQLLVSVRSAGSDAYDVTVADAPAVRVQRRDLGQTSSTRWSWQGEGGLVRATVDKLGADLSVALKGLDVVAKVEDGRKALLQSLGLAQPRGPSGPLSLRTQIPGRVVKVLVALGATVQEGQPLVVVEAMKMENETRAPRSGVVAELPLAEGTTVEAGACLIVLAPMP